MRGAMFLGGAREASGTIGRFRSALVAQTLKRLMAHEIEAISFSGSRILLYTAKSPLSVACKPSNTDPLPALIYCYLSQFRYV